MTERVNFAKLKVSPEVRKVPDLTDREITTFYRGVQKWCAEAGYELYLYEVRQPEVQVSMAEFQFFIRPTGNFEPGRCKGVNLSVSQDFLKSSAINVTKSLASAAIKRYEERT